MRIDIALFMGRFRLGAATLFFTAAAVLAFGAAAPCRAQSPFASDPGGALQSLGGTGLDEGFSGLRSRMAEAREERHGAPRVEFCARAGDPDAARAALYQPENRLSFDNAGGLGGGGVCWWHSRLQRSFAYLAVYRPDLPGVSSPDQAARIVRSIMNHHVTEVPGFADLRAFSERWEGVIQAALERQQKLEAVFNFQWLRALEGPASVRAESLAALMDGLYEEVEGNRRVAFQVWQMPGLVGAHSWLVVRMRRSGDGYELDVIDSNVGDVETIPYSRGATAFEKSEIVFVPHTEAVNESRAIERSVASYCAGSAEPG